MAKHKVIQFDTSQLKAIIDGLQNVAACVERVSTLTKKTNRGLGQSVNALKKIEETTRATKNNTKGVAENTEKTKKSQIEILATFRNIESGFNKAKRGFVGFFTVQDAFKKPLLDLAQLHYKVMGIGASTRQIVSLGEAMRKFGGNSQTAAQWTGNMMSNIADMQWGGEGGALGQIAMDYGLEFTGNESIEEINDKIKNLLDSLPKLQQIRVKNMLGMDDSLFAAMTEKDINGKSTWNSSLKKGEEEANRRLARGVEEKSLKANEASANRDASQETFALQEAGSLTKRIVDCDNLVASFNRTITESNRLLKAYARTEWYARRTSAAAETGGGVIQTIKGINDLREIVRFGKTLKSAGNIVAHPIKSLTHLGRTVSRGFGSAAHVGKTMAQVGGRVLGSTGGGIARAGLSAARGVGLAGKAIAAAAGTTAGTLLIGGAAIAAATYGAYKLSSALSEKWLTRKMEEANKKSVEEAKKWNAEHKAKRDELFKKGEITLTKASKSIIMRRLERGADTPIEQRLLALNTLTRLKTVSEEDRDKIRSALERLTPEQKAIFDRLQTMNLSELNIAKVSEMVQSAMAKTNDTNDAAGSIMNEKTTTVQNNKTVTNSISINVRNAKEAEETAKNLSMAPETSPGMHDNEIESAEANYDGPE